MESFFLAETTKYLYLLFDTDNFIHNQGQHGTVIDTPNGECIIDAGGYIFNTEAHPVDPSALHCCHDVPKQKLFDFSHLNKMKNVFKGDSIEKRKVFPGDQEGARETETGNQSPVQTKNDENLEKQSDDIVKEGGVYPEGELITDGNASGSHDDVLVKITTESKMKLDDNDSFNLKGTADIPEATEAPIPPVNLTFSSKFDPQAMLEKIRFTNRYPQNKTWEHNYKLLSCKAQPFIEKLSIFGEFFNG